MTTIDEFKEKIHNSYKPEEGKLYVIFTQLPDRTNIILQKELNSFSFPKCESILPIDFSKFKKNWKFLGMLFNSIKIVSNDHHRELNEEYLSILKKSTTSEQTVDSFFNTIGFNTSESGILSQFQNKFDKTKFIQSVIEDWPKRMNSVSIEDFFLPFRYIEKEILSRKIAFRIIVPIILEKKKIPQEFIQIIPIFQNLLLKKVSIFILIPDISEGIKDKFIPLFSPIASKEIYEITEKGINISQDVIDWVNMNYEMLNYNIQSFSIIDSFKIIGFLKNSASQDIAGLRYLLESCLLREYRESKFNKWNKKIQKSWDDVVKKHKNYYPQASRKMAPNIVIARKSLDTENFIKKKFNMNINDLFILTINNVIIENPLETFESTIRNLFCSYLDGEIIEESKINPELESLLDGVYSLLSNTTRSINKNEILEAVLLQGKKIIVKEYEREKKPKKSKIERWFDSNWKTILSPPTVSTIKECFLANKKKVLLDDPLLREDRYHWIYYKLKRDMLELRSKYIDELEQSIQFLRSEDLKVSLDFSKIESDNIIEMIFHARNKPPFSLLLTIEIPYYSVKLNAESIKTPLPQVVFNHVIIKLRDYLHTGPDISQHDKENIFLKSIKMYSMIKNKKPEDMIFIEDLIEFIQNIPHISDVFRYTIHPSVENGVKKILSEKNFFSCLIEKGLSPQMKGSDSYDSFTSDGKSYVGFVLTKKFLENGE